MHLFRFSFPGFQPIALRSLRPGTHHLLPYLLSIDLFLFPKKTSSCLYIFIPPVRDMSALVRSVTSVVTASRPEQRERLDKWNGWANAKSASAQDSLTAVHRFVAYNAGWLQQALGGCYNHRDLYLNRGDILLLGPY